MLEGGENCVKYLKRGGTEKRGRETMILKKGGGQAGSRSECLKIGDWNPLTAHEYLIIGLHLRLHWAI